MWEEDGTGGYLQLGRCTPAIPQLQPGWGKAWGYRGSRILMAHYSVGPKEMYTPTPVLFLVVYCLVAAGLGRAKVASSKEGQSPRQVGLVEDMLLP